LRNSAKKPERVAWHIEKRASTGYYFLNDVPLSRDGRRHMFGKGKIHVAIPRSYYKPGEVISGAVSLEVKKPVKARGVKISLIGDIQTTARKMGTGQYGTSTETTRYYTFEQELDGEKQYDGKHEYNFEIKLPEWLLSGKPSMPSVEGKIGTVLKVAEAASTIAGLMPTRQIKWYLKARLDVSGGLDISKKVDLTIG
jgi:hypothetical protein